MMICETEQEQRVWDSAYGAAAAIGWTARTRAGVTAVDVANNAVDVANDAVDGLRGLTKAAHRGHDGPAHERGGKTALGMLEGFRHYLGNRAAGLRTREDGCKTTTSSTELAIRAEECERLLRDIANYWLGPEPPRTIDPRQAEKHSR